MKITNIDREALKKSIADSAGAVASLDAQVETIAAIGEALVGVLKAGGKVLTAGNGGSGADALHMAEEFVGRFLSNRRSLPAIALLADSTALTCIGNDFGFDEVFRRQIQGLGKAGDILFLFSSSGKSMNLRLALEEARRMKIVTVCLLGRDGGPMAGMGDYEVIVGGCAGQRVQEAHQVLMHLLLEIVEPVFA